MSLDPRSPDPAFDRRLVLGACAGDPQALDAIVVLHHPGLRRYVRALLGGAAASDAEEALQDTWLRALRGFARGAEPDRLRPWLLALARRAAIDRLRRRSRPAALELEDPSSIAETESEPWPEGVEAEELRRAVEGLGAAEREVVVLHHLERVPVLEVAAVLGVPEGTVKSRLHRARRELRARLTSRS